MRGIKNYIGNGKVPLFPIYGKEFTLETDQKPLVSIYKKHMVDISPRVQRLIVRSFPYLPFHVVYKKGKDIPVADAFSHVTSMDPEDNIQLPIIAVNMITTHILMSVHPQDTFSKKLDRLRKSTVQDNQLTRLSHYINTGFPCDKKNLLTELQGYTINRKWSHYLWKQDHSSKGDEPRCCSTSTRDIRVRKDVYYGLEAQYFGQRSRMISRN